jgi:hypothetical protein
MLGEIVLKVPVAWQAGDARGAIMHHFVINICDQDIGGIGRAASGDVLKILTEGAALMYPSGERRG